MPGIFWASIQPGKTFEVLIQLGAILAIVVVYFRTARRTSPSALPIRRRPPASSLLGIFIAFLPAAVIGAALHGFIKDVLFEIAGAHLHHADRSAAFVLLAVDRIKFTPRYHRRYDIPPVARFQDRSLPVPGDDPRRVAVRRRRSSARLLLGTEKRAAAEFSFFLAMPTMAGAFAYDLYKNWSNLACRGRPRRSAWASWRPSSLPVIVVRYALAFIGRHGFTPFAWWRIVVGVAGLARLRLAEPAACPKVGNDAVGIAFRD